MDLMELIAGQLSNPNILKQLGSSVNASPEQVEKVAKIGLPTMIEQINRNTSSTEGKQALANALDQHKDDDINDLAGFLNGVDTADGAKILQHVFLNKNEKVQNSLAKQSGMKSSQVSSIMSMLAPMVLGILGNQKKSQGLDADGVANLTSQLTNSLGGNSGLMGIATKLLDSDGDGDIIDDLGGLLGKFFKK